MERGGGEVQGGEEEAEGCENYPWLPPRAGLCGNEGLEATLLLPDAVRPLRSPLMHGPSHQDFSIPSRYTLPHTLMCAHTCTCAKTQGLLTRRGRCKVSFLAFPNKRL